MTNKTLTINNWGILNLFTSYLKHNKAIIFSMFLLPLIFIVAVSVNYNTIMGNENVSPALIIMLLWLVQSTSFAVQTFLTILLDFKQSIIYRRIGLTRIKKVNFLIMSSIFNLILMTISNFFIFLVIIILAIAFKENNLLNAIFQWQMLLSILFTLACSVLLTSVALLMSSLIKTRTGQTISALIVNFLIILPLFVLIFFVHSLSNSTSQLIDSIGLGGVIGIFVGAFVLINLISVLLYYLSWKLFRWYE
ncbi:hypothetical protein [Spiroplasma platyhelix]|uniref:Uncharacterized protein n=1 Tax=Spiroplasma platyhelix PALS-1 TaxID=1276218 RepID=A0A846TWA9_9MOLU|nr:hypothetical protein [Spiroplasma platyhelix]MBE4703908.1 hypothetical protein [Spiroplasma platyhelix PALS-1]NKE38281.1 hypothetical protein [Spiroplasma platyhelix PALS-1]UJB29166.1 hypothetical protein SPLAT_v1c04020 [Spiroplasma platyhelix PALS-1]